MSLQLLTESRQRAQRRCQREEQLRYQQGFISVSTADALRFGSLLHYGLEGWWKATEDRLAAAMQAITDHLTTASDPYEIVDAEELLRGYDARWRDEPFETIVVEAEFRTALVNPETGASSRTFERAGKLDAIAWRDGGKKLIEHKSSSEDITPGSPYWAKLRMDGQVSGYFRGAESLGHECDECIYDVIGKVSLRPKKATPAEERKYTKPTKADPVSRLYANQRDQDETTAEYRARVREHIAENPDRYYVRGTVVRLESEMRAYDLETWQQASQMREAQRLGIAPRNPDACVRFSQVCSYFEACSGTASLEDQSRFKKLDWVYPELEAPKVA